MFLGELISLFVAISWTATALFAEVGSKRMGSLPFNTVRMTMSLAFLVVTLWLVMGVPYPRYADGGTWTWLLLSGVVGYVIGDYCLMQGYIHIGSRFGQLFMTLSAPTAALTGLLFLGERLRPTAILGMVITLSGIALSILSKNDDSQKHGIKFSERHFLCGDGWHLPRFRLSAQQSGIKALRCRIDGSRHLARHRF